MQQCIQRIARKYGVAPRDVEQIIKRDEEQCRQLQDTLLYLYPDTVKSKPNACPTRKYYQMLCQLGSTIEPSIRACDTFPRKKLQQQLGSEQWQDIKKVLQNYLYLRPIQTKYVVDGISLQYEEYDEYYFDYSSYLRLDRLLRDVVSFPKSSTSRSKIFRGELFGVKVYVKQFYFSETTLLREKEIYRYLRMLQHVGHHPFAEEFRKYFIAMLICVRDAFTASIISEDCGGGSVREIMLSKPYFTEHWEYAIPKLMMDVLYGIFLLFQARIIHNDLHMSNMLLFPAPRQKQYVMFGTLYESDFPYQIKIYDFDRSCVDDPLFDHVVCDRNQQKDVFNWFALWEFHLLAAWSPLKNNKRFSSAWDGFHRDLQAVDRKDYVRLIKILELNRIEGWQNFCDVVSGKYQYETCNKITLKVLNLPTVVQLFYKNFESLLKGKAR